MRILIIGFMATLVGCVSPQKTNVGSITEILDSQGRVVQTTRVLDSRVAADTALANAVSECWKAQAEIDANSSGFNIPENADASTTAMLIMAQGLVESNKALANQNKPHIVPCSNIGTNSNDVLVAQEQGRTQRSVSRWGFAGKVAPIAIGAYAGVKAVQSITDLATAGLNAAGNRTTINGDNNRTIEQTADNQSTISDSGNYNEAGGIPVNETDISLTAANESEEEQEQTMEELCTAAGGTWIAEEQRCSDGNGGTIEL